MGERGPAPTPTAIRLLAGTPAGKLNRHEPKPAGAPRMPAGMSPAAKRVWRRVVRDYAHTGVLTAVDADVLRAYCDTVVRYEHAAALLEEMGPLVRGARKGELVKNPLHQIVRDNAVLERALARELGFTPAARTGLHADAPGESDPQEDFLSARRSA
jgi:P27 family predicted phage terminase small subunit